MRHLKTVASLAESTTSGIALAALSFRNPLINFCINLLFIISSIPLRALYSVYGQ